MHANKLILAILIVLAAGCETLEVNSDFDRAANFSQYRTFSWVSDNPLMASAPEASPLAEERIQAAISRELMSKGYSYVDDRAAASVLVGFTIGSRDKVSVNTTTYPVGFRGPYGWGRAYYQDVDVRQYTEGRLAIDIFDSKLRRPVWHGYATKNISNQDQADPQGLINQAVAAILAEFPPG